MPSTGSGTSSDSFQPREEENEMSTTESVSAAERLLAIEEIKTLSARYGLGLDEYNMEKLLTAYSEDIVFDASAFGLGSFRGHEELRGFFQHTFDVMKEQM